MPERSERAIRVCHRAFTLVEALLAFGVASGALLLVTAGMGPMMRLAMEARLQGAADRAAEAVLAEDLARRSRGDSGLRVLAAHPGEGLPAGAETAWWVDREGRVVAPVSEWRASGGLLDGCRPVFEAVAVAPPPPGAVGAAVGRRSLLLGWPAVDDRGRPVAWEQRRQRRWVSCLSP